MKKNATGRVLVGSLTRAVAKGDTTVTVTLARKARKRLRKADQVKPRAIARITDAAGNVRSKRLRIMLEGS